LGRLKEITHKAQITINIIKIDKLEIMVNSIEIGVIVVSSLTAKASASLMFLGLTSLRRSLISPSGIASMKCSNERTLIREQELYLMN
jgi:hypothetical protein